MAEEGVGGRIFAVRAALGGGVREPLALRAFADQLTAAATGGRRYHASQISGWETGKALPGLDDVAVIAAVDPKHRGPAWLAFGVAAQPVPDAARSIAVDDDDDVDAGLVTGPSPLEIEQRRRADEAKRRRRDGNGGEAAS